MSSFEDRVAAEHESAREATEAGERARARLDDQASAARSDALEFKPTVEAAVAAVARLPLPAPYGATDFDRRMARDKYVLKSEGVFHQSVSVVEEFKKPLIGKKGTVRPVAWSFSISSAGFARAWLTALAYPDGTSTFSVRTPAFVGGQPPSRTLDQFCELGIIRWEAGSYKDSSWSAGSLPVRVALDEFVTLAAKLVAQRQAGS
jgi:hypothetical protein